MAATLMAKAMSKSERDKYIRVLKNHGYTGIKVRVIHGKRILRDRILPATYYEIWVNK
jgi:hypothetical protein